MKQQTFVIWNDLKVMYVQTTNQYHLALSKCKCDVDATEPFSLPQYL